MKIAILYSNARETGVPMALPSDAIDRFAAAHPECELVLAETSEELISRGYMADILICWGTKGHCIVDEYCRYAKDTLRWIHILSAGVEGLMATSAVNIPGIIVTSSKGIHGLPMADQIFGYILSFLRGFDTYRKNQAAHLWERHMPDETYGKTLLILGAGNIGAVVAQRASAFSMKVIGVRRHPRPTEYFDSVVGEDDVASAFAQADIVVNLLPDSPSTQNYINAEKLAWMKNTAYFISVGRGATTDMAALVAALSAHTIAGAALDVFATEPLSKDSPIWDTPNLFITPHVAADSPLYMSRAFAKFERNYNNFTAGKEMESLVDLVACY